MFGVGTEFDAVLFKRSTTLIDLRTVSAGDTIKFSKSALTEVKLCPKNADEGSVGIWANQINFVRSLSLQETKRKRRIQWILNCLISQ